MLMAVTLAQDSCSSLYWQEQAERACVEGLKSVVPIEGCCSLILGIDDYRQHCRFRPKRPQDRVEQQSPAELLSPEALVHRQPADENRRENRIARKAAGLLRWQVLHGDAGRRQRIIPGNGSAAVRDRDEAVGHPPAHVLAGLPRQIAIKRLDPAGEILAVMGGRQDLDAKRRRHLRAMRSGGGGRQRPGAAPRSAQAG